MPGRTHPPLVKLPSRRKSVRRLSLSIPYDSLPGNLDLNDRLDSIRIEET